VSTTTVQMTPDATASRIAPNLVLKCAMGLVALIAFALLPLDRAVVGAFAGAVLVLLAAIDAERAAGNVLEHPFYERWSAGALTQRELEIVTLAARGYTNSQIAERLWITRWTVKYHLANAYKKLGVSNRTQAARQLFERRLSGHAPCSG